MTACQIPIGFIMTYYEFVLSCYHFKFRSFYFKYIAIKAQLLTLVTVREAGPPSFSSPENNQRSDPLQAPGEKDYHAGQDHQVDHHAEEGKLYISGNVGCDEKQGGLGDNEDYF